MTMPGGRSGGSVYLTVLPDARLLGPRLVSQARQATNAAERKAGKIKVTPDTRGFGSKLDRGVRRPMQQAGHVGRAAFSWLAAGTVAVGINSAVQAASDLNETVNKSKVVFGPASALVEEFGRDAATSMGMSREEAISAAATFGNLFVSMKMGQQQSAEMSTKLVQLAGDMASFNNASPEDTLRALQAGLVGQVRPLRQYGINLDAASLKQEAMRLGLGHVGATLTASQRAQAAYSLILQQSGTAQGDFARTSDQLANRQRIMAAQFKDTKETLGVALLPAFTSAAGAASTLATGFLKLDEATGGVSTKLLLGAIAVSGIAYASARMITTLGNARAAWLAYRAEKALQVTTNAAAATSEVELAAATNVSSAAATRAGGSFLATAGKLGLFAAAAAAGAYEGHRLSEMFNENVKQGGPFGTQLDWINRHTTIHFGKTKQATGATKEQSSATREAAEIARGYKEALEGMGGVEGANAPKIQAMTEQVKAQRSEIAQIKTSTEQAIIGYQGLLSQSKVTTSGVIKDLANQVSNFRTYAKDSQRLIRAGVSPAAIRELSVKGPEYVHRLAQGSNAQLQTYKGYWRDRQKEIKGGFATSMAAQVADLEAKIKRMQKAINRLEGKTVPVKATAYVEIDPDTKKGLLALGIKGYGTKFFAKGGKVTDGTTSTADDVLAFLSKRETVVSAHDSEDPWFQAWAKARNIPGYAAGGLVGGFLNPAVAADRRYGQLSAERLADKTGKALGAEVKKAAGGMLGGLAGPGGWQWQIGVLRAAFPGLALISGFRPGARTHATGAVSYHARGRAVDVPPRMDVFNWIRGHYGARTKELIFTPAGSRQLHNGQPHIYTGVTAADHWNHVHWAYRTGAWKILADQIARVHRGEMIVPAAPAERIRQGVEGGGLGGIGSVDELVSKLADAIAANPPRIYLDRQEVSRAIATGNLWNSRR